jgi:diaminopimelate epimerase
MGAPFVKMHGLGNDFVVLDARSRPLVVAPEQARQIGDRHKGVGFDQLILIEPPRDRAADVFLRFLNTDGSESGACGNGTRCVARLLMDESGRDSITIETLNGLLEAELQPDRLVSVDMGRAMLDWREIPLASACDTNHVPVSNGPLSDPVCVSMGNPHAVFFTPDLARIDLAALGPGLETHPMFPQRANIGVAQILSRSHIRLRVWERGVGITLACGSGACAAIVAASRRGLTERAAWITVDGGGDLAMEWLPDGHVLMTGPTATSFTGELPTGWVS